MIRAGSAKALAINLGLPGLLARPAAAGFFRFVFSRLALFLPGKREGINQFSDIKSMKLAVFKKKKKKLLTGWLQGFSGVPCDFLMYVEKRDYIGFLMLSVGAKHRT